MRHARPVLVATTVGGCLAAASFILLACGENDAASGRDLEAGSSLPNTDAGALDDGDVASTRPPFDAAAPSVACAVTPCFTRIVAGPTSYCALANDGVVRCWGSPSALGDFASGASGDPGATPVALTGLGAVVDIGASALRTCVALSDGGVDCFGRDEPRPTRVPSPVAAKSLAIGADRSCLVGTAGELWCWGDSDATGKGDTTVNLAGDPAGAVVMTTAAVFATGASGALFSWGSEPMMLGRDTSLGVDWSPGRVGGIGAALQVAASDLHVCALTVEGRLFCWGHDDSGALGLGAFRSVAVPTEVFFSSPFAWPAQIAVATTHSCSRMTDGSLFCWARVNASGELGYAARTGVFTPTRVGLPKPIVAVATGTGSTCVLVLDGSIQCLGDNTYGQLGIGKRDADRHFVPTTVVFP
ncbi:MAG: regulator of chromosome condensation [Labilithrix sp.]|nr:regulator of chromosome condensation [Labilithrix sp.]